MSDSPLSWLRKVGGAAPEAAPAGAPQSVPATEKPAPVPSPAAAPAVALPPPAPGMISGPEPTPDGYRAYGSDHADSVFLNVRRKPDVGQEEEGEIMPLTYLLRVVYSAGPMGDRVTLIFSECAFNLTGIHLKGLCRELMAGKVNFVQEFDASRHPTRPAAGTPIILGIEIVQPGDLPASGRRSVAKKKADA